MSEPEMKPKKPSLISHADEPVDERRVQQLRMLTGVAMKALDMGKGNEAERMLVTAIADCTRFAERATTRDDLDLVAEIHTILAPILPRLETATGKRWTACLDVLRPRKRRTLPRGQA